MFNFSLPSLKAAALSALAIAGASQASALSFNIDLAINPVTTQQFTLKGSFDLTDGGLDYEFREDRGTIYEQTTLQLAAQKGASLEAEGLTYDLSEFEISLRMTNSFRSQGNNSRFYVELQGPVNPDTLTGALFKVRLDNDSPLASDQFGKVDQETALALFNASAASILRNPKVSEASRINAVFEREADGSLSYAGPAGGKAYFGRHAHYNATVLNEAESFTVPGSVSAVPLPATALLLPVALSALGFAGKRRRKAA